MLEPEQIRYIDNHFSVFDQDWRFYSSFLGEPYLIQDRLVYFDSKILYICAFPLSDASQEITSEDIQVIGDAFSQHMEIKGINIWGRIKDIPPCINIGQSSLKLLDPLGEYNSEDRESIVDVGEFSYELFSKARAAKNASTNKGNKTVAINRSMLTHQHIALIEKFSALHPDISRTHTAVYLSASNLLRYDSVYFIECYQKEQLTGFGIFSLLGKKSANFIWGFYDNAVGSRASDAVMDGAIELCQNKGVKNLHLGYSANNSLLEFKKKWGATKFGPTYREVFFSKSSEINDRIKKGTFLWRERVFQKL